MKHDKILIIDDEEDFIMTLKYFFEKNGYEVITAHNGVEGLKEAKRIPDIILLDVNMPVMNGFETLHRLRTGATTWDIPVIMLTVSADMKTIREAQGLKATDYIMKSDSMERILAGVERYISLNKGKSDFLIREEKPRISGISILGDVVWGKHIGAFYMTKDDLLSMLVPYYKAGLLGNELCIWVLSEGLGVEDAKKVLGKEIKNISSYIDKGQMKIIDSEYLYKDSLSFNEEETIDFWNREEENALRQGFDGMRISGSGNWGYRSKWEALCDYEKHVNGLISRKKIIAICTYSFYKFSMLAIITLGVHHEVIIAKQGDKSVNFAPTSQEIFLEHFDISGRGIKKQ